jgi:hypothetical protein
MFCFFSFLVLEAAVVCPPTAVYEPCSCSESTSTGAIKLNCFNKNLGDAQVNELLDAFLATPGVSPLLNLDLTTNKLTRVPDQIRLFPEFNYISLSSNNITSPVGKCSFNFTDGTVVRYLSLSNNKVTTIAPGAFQDIRLSNSYKLN